MAKTAKVSIGIGSAADFFKRSRERAAKMKRGETIASEVRITFEDPLDMLRALTSEKIRLVRALEGEELGITDLANALKRDRRAVSRDVSDLESLGLIETEYRSNPGHGRHRVVRPLAKRYELVAEF